MTPKDVGQRLIAHLRAIVAASDALDRLGAAEADKALTKGWRVVRTSWAPEVEAAEVHDWHTGEYLGKFAGDPVFGPTRFTPMPSHWISYTRVEEFSFNQNPAVFEATERLFALADAPLDWLTSWENSDQIEQIRAFLNQVQD